MLHKKFALLGELLSKKPVLAACISGIAAMLLVSGYIKNREATLLQVTKARQVSIAARDVAAGEFLSADAVETADVPTRFIEPGAFSKLADVTGRVAVIPLRKGTQFTPSNARLAGDVQALASIIPSGKRAVALSFDDAAGLAGLIKPNDTVDVLATFDLGFESSVRRTTLSVVENAAVLAVNTEIADAAPRQSSKDSKGGIFGNTQAGKQDLTRNQTVITLAVTPAEAQSLAFARDSGILSLSMRPFGDAVDNTRPAPTTIASITGGHEELVSVKRSFREYRGK